jgi:hypothetical protein
MLEAGLEKEGSIYTGRSDRRKTTGKFLITSKATLNNWPNFYNNVTTTN